MRCSTVGNSRLTTPWVRERTRPYERVSALLGTTLCLNTERVLLPWGGMQFTPGKMLALRNSKRSSLNDAASRYNQLLQRPSELIITGNGPVVGKILMRQVLSTPDVPPCPWISASPVRVVSTFADAGFRERAESRRSPPCRVPVDAS